MTNLNMYIAFAKYCKENKLCFERNNNGYKKMQQLWNQFFDKNVSLKNIIKKSANMRQNGYSFLFVIKVSLEKKINILGEHCIKNKIYFDIGKENHKKMKQIYFDCFQENITIETARKHITKLKQSGFHQICHKNQPSLKTRLLKFIDYCKDKSILFNIGRDGYIQLSMHWCNYFDKNISIRTASKYATKLRKLTFGKLFHHKTSMLKQDHFKFAEYCISKNITFQNNLKIYEDIKNTWDEYFNVDININTLKTFISSLRKNGYLKLFPKQRLSINHKVHNMANYSKKNNIKISYGKTGITEIQDIHKYCFNETCSYVQANRYKTILKKEYKYLFDKRIHRKYQIKELSEHLIKNNILIHKGQKGFRIIKEIWEMLYNEKITNIQAVSYCTELKKLNIENLFQETESIKKKLIEFTTYCINKDMKFKQGKNNKEAIKRIWDEFFNENINPNTLIKHLAVIKQTINSEIFPPEMISQNDKINIISNYCINKHIQLSFDEKGHEQLIKIHIKCFDKTIKTSTAIKYIRNIGYTYPELIYTDLPLEIIKKRLEKARNKKSSILFPKLNSIDTKINVIATYCVENNILLENNSKAYREIQEIYEKCFNSTIDIRSMCNYHYEILKFYPHLIKIEKPLNQKINEFCQNCKNNNITFTFANDIGSIKLKEEWDKYFYEDITLTTAKQYCKIIKSDEYSSLFIQYKLKIKPKINEFAKYCIINSIKIGSNKLIQKTWLDCFQEEIELKSANRCKTLLSQSEYKNQVILKVLTVKDKIHQFGEYCLKHKIYFTEGEKRKYKLQNEWIKCFKENIHLSTIERYVSNIKNSGYTNLFIARKKVKDKNINIFKKYCIDNQLTFNTGTKAYKEIEKVWEILFIKKISSTYIKYIMSLMNNSENQLFFQNEIIFNKNNYNSIAKYCIQNFITIEKDDLDKIQEVWFEYYQINISREDAEKHMKEFLYEIKLLEDEKWSIFAEYCNSKLISFQSTSKSEDEIQTAWRNCFND